MVTRPLFTSDQVYEYLRNQILYGEIEPGQRLIQDEVAEQLNTSRTPVREAFRCLLQDGLVERLPRGVRVPPIEIEMIRHVFGVRGALEAYAVELACECIADGTIAQLEGIKHHADAVFASDTLGKAEKIRRFFDLNTAFHDTIYEATGNPYLTKTIFNLRNLVLRMRAVGLRKDSTWNQVWKEHEELIALLKQRDKEAASRCIRRHVANAASYVISIAAKTASNESDHSDPTSSGAIG